MLQSLLTLFASPSTFIGGCSLCLFLYRVKTSNFYYKSWKRAIKIILHSIKHKMFWIELKLSSSSPNSSQNLPFSCLFGPFYCQTANNADTHKNLWFLNKEKYLLGAWVFSRCQTASSGRGAACRVPGQTRAPGWRGHAWDPSVPGRQANKWTNTGYIGNHK